MKLKLALILAVFTSPAFADVVASCPEPQSIYNTHSIYMANNESGNWIGIARPSNSGSVVSFREAIILNVVPSFLGKCTYNLSNGFVDMHMDESRGTPVSIDNYESNWERVTGDLYDIFECRGSASSCTFELTQQ